MFMFFHSLILGGGPKYFLSNCIVFKMTAQIIQNKPKKQKFNNKKYFGSPPRICNLRKQTCKFANILCHEKEKSRTRKPFVFVN